MHIKTASNGKKIVMSRQEWLAIGKKAGWTKVSGRKFTWLCPRCRKKSLQDWEEPEECPYCDGDEDEEDLENDNFPDYDDGDYGDEALEWGGRDYP